MDAPRRATLDARTLRELAETADGTRDTELAIVETPVDGCPGEFTYAVLGRAEAETSPGVRSGRARIVLGVHTPSHTPQRKQAEVSITVDGVPVLLDEHVGNVDAVFLTESAVEKFLFPYYESVRIWGEDFLPRLKAAYYDPSLRNDIVAVTHTPPSHPIFARDAAHAGSVQALLRGSVHREPLFMVEDALLEWGRLATLAHR